MDNRSPFAVEGIADSERVAGLLNYGSVNECLTESLYWLRYNPETDGPTDIAVGTSPVEGIPDNDPVDEALNVSIRLQNRALALLTFKSTMSTKELVLNAMKRDTDDHNKYLKWVVFLIPEEVNRLQTLESDNYGSFSNGRKRYSWTLESDRLTVSRW